MKPKLIPGLTGLRGIAAIWVVFYHLQWGDGVAILNSGYLGVDVFFILSGFVLSHVYADDFQRANWSTYTKFLKARVARIYPLHLFMLGVLVLITWTLPGFVAGYHHGQFTPDAFVASVFLVQSWAHWIPTCWNCPSWSLSAEWLAYLIFPFFVISTQRWKSVTVAFFLAFLSLTTFMVAIRLDGAHSPDVEGTPGLLRMGFEFAAGCLIFRAVRLGARPLPMAADIAALALLSVALLVPSTAFLALFAFALIIRLAAQGKGLIAAALSNGPVLFFGEISYSIYLVHWIVIQISNWALGNAKLTGVEFVARDAGLVGIILVLSCATYYFVERPARSWGRSFNIPVETAVANSDAI